MTPSIRLCSKLAAALRRLRPVFRGTTGAMLVALCMAAPAVGTAAEIQLRSECRSDGGLILLGEIAQIYAQDDNIAKQLAAIDITPAPPAGERRYLRSREVQDILASRGVNLRQHRFSGASQVALIGTMETPPPKVLPTAAPRKIVPTMNPRQVSDELRKALVAYLRQQAGQDVDWNTKFELTPEQAQTLALAPQTLTITGGSEPWTGPQQFLLSIVYEGDTRQVKLRAEVMVPPTVVVAARTLPRGSLIHEGDVRLQQGQASKGDAQVFLSLHEVMGKEVTKTIVEGQLLDDHHVRMPVLVHKGEVVTVYARAAGITIRTTARSRDEGCQGEVVTIESLADRKSFFARVVAPQEVEVYAHAAPVASDQPLAAQSASPQAPQGLALQTPQPPQPPVRIASARPAPKPWPRSGAAAGGVQQASATSPVTAATIPAPGSILAQAALRGRNAPAANIEKKSVYRPQKKKAEAEATAPDDAD